MDGFHVRQSSCESWLGGDPGHVDLSVALHLAPYNGDNGRGFK